MKMSTVKKLYNLWIRLRDSNQDGFLRCCTCGSIKYYKDCDAGHFIHGLDFVGDNQHGQCRKCNYYNSDMKHNYLLFMINRYGEQRVQELKVMKKMALKGQNKHSQAELEIMAAEFKKRIKDEKAKRGIK